MTAQDPLPPPAKRIQYSRQPQQTFPDRVYFGDLHTSYLGTYDQRLRTGRCVARETTSEALWDALASEEVYATTGSRAVVRVFRRLRLKAHDLDRSKFPRESLRVWRADGQGPEARSERDGAELPWYMPCAIRTARASIPSRWDRGFRSAANSITCACWKFQDYAERSAMPSLRRQAPGRRAGQHSESRLYVPGLVHAGVSALSTSEKLHPPSDRRWSGP